MKKIVSNDFLGKIINIKIDRPLGTKHPKYDFTYPINYGFVPDTISGDGEEIDAYVIGPKIPLDSFVGYCCAIIHRLDDDDDKLIIVPQGQNLTDEEIEKEISFQEKWFKHIIIRKN